jgi:transposase
LNAENIKLKEQLALQKKGKESKTSSTPPSQDFSKTKSNNLRVKSGKKSGGQKGHEGSTIEFNPNPTSVIEHHPTSCSGCGSSLSSSEFQIVESRQVIDIPPIIAEIIEHRVSVIQCPCCSNMNRGEFPKNINKPVQYGPNIIATIGYLNIEQYIPYRRSIQLIEDLFSIKISEGSVSNFINRLAINAMPIYEKIRERISVDRIVGSDETGTYINGKKGWFHVWQNGRWTFIGVTMNRGFASIEKYFEEGFPFSTYVSDCWAAQMKVASKYKQICIAHILRELQKFIEVLGCEWSKKFLEILMAGLEKRKMMLKFEYQNNLEVQELKKQLIGHLYTIPKSNNQKLLAFIKRMTKYQDYIFTFLEIYGVPPDNNGSERAIRVIKVKNKVSTCFRSLSGAEKFAVLRSVADTARKNNRNIYNAFLELAKF